MIETIIILGIMVVILGYTTINLLFKNEQAEDMIISQQKYISSISEIIKNSEKRLREIDEKEVFKSFKTGNSDSLSHFNARQGPYW